MMPQLTARTDFLSQQGILGLKAEFEAEGSTFEEMAALTRYAVNLELGLTLKIGGCEAVTDLVQALSISPKQIVAPMIESPFAVRKFGQMMAKWDPRRSVRRMINVETISAVKLLPELLDACRDWGIDGIVIGRGDLTESMGLPRSEVDSSHVFAQVIEVIKRCDDLGLTVGVGGGVSPRSIEQMEELADYSSFSYFETRKVLIEAKVPDKTKTIRSALAFELSWLEERAQKAARVSEGDMSRIERLSKELGL